MDIKEFTKEMATINEVSAEYIDEVIRTSLAACTPEMKQVVCMEELSELQQAIAKNIRNEGSVLHTIEEMADVYICLEMMRRIYCISQETLDRAVAVKIKREGERRGITE